MSIEQIERMRAIKLHEKIGICEGVEAMRVPNGWIYIYRIRGNMSTSFMPEVLPPAHKVAKAGAFTRSC